jgi:hypothetical protein
MADQDIHGSLVSEEKLQQQFIACNFRLRIDREPPDKALVALLR